MAELLHRSLFLNGPAGRLEALLWSVPDRADGQRPALAATVCHPHPLYGGTLHNKVVYQLAKTLHRFGLPVLRFNFRGTGRSEGNKLAALVARFSTRGREQTRTAVISGADHFFTGHLPELDRTVAAWLRELHPELPETGLPSL